jgi:hypothetical protein
MAGRNGQPPVIARLFACYLQVVPGEILPPSVINENCPLVMNAYFFQQYYMLVSESGYQSN